MKPADIALFRIPGRPALAADGSIVVAVTAPDLVADLYRSTLRRLSGPGITAAASTTAAATTAAATTPASTTPAATTPAATTTASAGRDLTLGPRDSEPVISPDGLSVVFLRAAESGPAQLYVMALDGGEPRKLTDHLLGAGSVVFSAAGSRIAYCAAVPEPGRYGSEESVKPDAEPPRRITRLAYRLDGEGFVADKPKQLFVLDLVAAARPVQLTDEPSGVADPAFTRDGRLVYVRSTGIDELTEEIAIIEVPADLTSPADTAPARGRLLVRTHGSAALLTVAGPEIYYCGIDFTGIDAVGRTTGLWTASVTGGSPRRLTDEDSVDIDRAAGRPQLVDAGLLVGVLDRGATTLCSVPIDATAAPLDQLAVVVGGGRVVRAFAARGRTVAAVVADGSSAGEVVTVTVGVDGSGAGETTHSDFGSALVGSGIRPAVELTATSPDGYPVHGWLVGPPGPGPHPVLLVVHGGPHAAYGPAVFDEAQVYAGAGYAVVLGNPRGSASYGQRHGRAAVGALGTIDVDDVLALLDAALARPECDATRVGVMGGSYGGFMTSWLCSHAPDRFVAAISERAVNSWDSFAGSSDIGYYFAQAYVGADRDAQWRASPLAYADRISVPLLIIHSEQDWRCPVEQAQRMYVALKLRDAEVEMLLFPGEGHELSRSGRPGHRRHRFDAILAWWNRHLPVSGS